MPPCVAQTVNLGTHGNGNCIHQSAVPRCTRAPTPCQSRNHWLYLFPKLLIPARSLRAFALCFSFLLKLRGRMRNLASNSLPIFSLSVFPKKLGHPLSKMHTSYLNSCKIDQKRNSTRTICSCNANDVSAAFLILQIRLQRRC